MTMEYYVRDPFGQPVRIGDFVAGCSAPDQLPIFGPVVTLSNTVVTVARLTEGDDGGYRLVQGDEQQIPLGKMVFVRPRTDIRLHNCTCACSLAPHPLDRPHADDCPALDPATRTACRTPGPTSATRRDESPEPILHDAGGHAIREKDIVGGTTSGRYQATIVGPIDKIGKGRVRILVTTTTRGDLGSDVGSTVWINTDRVFIVAARHAEDYPARPANGATP